jgi:hypothetical protein
MGFRQGLMMANVLWISWDDGWRVIDDGELSVNLLKGCLAGY